MEAVFCNDLILEKIFQFFSTPYLLLNVNRVASKWNLVASKLVERKRQIYLHKDNILDYAQMISSGGTPHKNIKLKLRYLKENDLRRFARINSTLAKFAGNVRELDILSTIFHNDGYQVDDYAEYPNFLAELLIQSKNVVSLSIDIDNPAKDVDFPKICEIKQLSALKFLHIETAMVDSENNSQLILTFLHLAPNLEVIHFGHMEMDIQVLDDIEVQFPGFIQKIGSLKIPHFCQETGRYLLSENFVSLKIFEALSIENFGTYVKVLEKYASQLVKIKVGILDYDNEGLSDSINLPVMTNLETLRIFFNGFDLGDPKCFALRFWKCSKADHIFPNLTTFSIHVKTFVEQKPFPFEMLENFLYTALPDLPSHPIFPNVKSIPIFTIGVENSGNWVKPEVCSRVYKYFPNCLF